MAAGTLTGGPARVRIRVEGTVQGVGFRPHVYRLAHELGLAGFVCNDARGVVVEVEGDRVTVDELIRRLEREAPPLAAIERVSTELLAPTGAGGFRITASAGGVPDAPVTPDAATCEDCLRELFERSNRRFRYPFINCTACGPRFTIVRGIPYDRPLTTMAAFQMCPACRAEYEDPLDRRFHAQPNACPVCGPHVWLVDRSGRPLSEREHALRDAAAALRAGAIVAVKGLGGFHLACAAVDEDAVAALRARKHRESKPFALMAGDLEAAGALVDLSPRERKLLLGRERPIVIAPRRPGAALAPSVAPRTSDLGVMLPYSPLHHLLLHDTGQTLVMTSGNVCDEPIAYQNEDALARLGGIAELFLLHDRPIETRADDSVARARADRPPILIRRSRGYVPSGLPLPVPADRPLLACGAELKSTFCLARGGRAWVSHHIGDLENYETLRSFVQGISHFERLFAVRPEIVAHDLHPEYLSSKYALERDGAEPVAVQHHHAHLAACIAEHGERGPALGVIYDGTGHGTDGTVWGGELLIGDLEGFRRVGHLWPVALPGGVAAIREPWRMACAWLVELGAAAEPPAPIAGAVSGRDWERVARLAQAGLASPRTTSVGRLYDAVAALCGVRLTVDHEGQAAAELEAACDPDEHELYPLPVSELDGRLALDARETIRGVLRDIRAGTRVPTVAARFHNALAEATARACLLLADRSGIGTVALAGGSFQNRRLLQCLDARLSRAGLKVLVPERLPPNDGGISYGQAAVAAARGAAGTHPRLHDRRTQSPQVDSTSHRRQAAHWRL